jgi:hypothetical protein
LTKPRPAPSPTIRLFVSSTFSDLKAERDALQREVFPRLKQLCLSRGLRFQAIDLRWGISEEAGRDNRTISISVLPVVVSGSDDGSTKYGCRCLYFLFEEEQL